MRSISSLFCGRRLCLLLGLCVSMLVMAADDGPRWLRHLPKNQNETYRYQIEYGVDKSENVAYEIAYAKLVRSAMNAIGMTYTADDVNEAVQTGQFTNAEGVVVQLPIRAVCSYRQAIPGGVRVYILGQVGAHSRLYASVKFTEFRDCDDDGSVDIELVDQRPEEWKEYETTDYEYSSCEMDMGQDRLTCQHTIEAQARQSLIHHVHLQDTALHQLIHVNSYLGKSVAYAIAYIKKESILEYYMESARADLNICGGWLDNVSSYIREGKMGDAKALVHRAKKNLEMVNGKLTYLKGNLPSAMFYRDIQTSYSDLKVRVEEGEMMTKDGDREQRENKVREYVDLADKTLKKNAVGDALRYLYAAQLLLADMGSHQHIKMHDPHLGQVQANVYIANKIKQILTDVKVVCDGTMPGNPHELKLSFIYNQKPITTLSFMYNANVGWSDNTSILNGWSTASIPEKNKPKQLHVLLDYRCAAEATFDAELPELYELYQSKFNYDKAAKKIVEVKLEDISQVAQNTEATPMVATAVTNIHETAVVGAIKETSHVVTAEDSVKFSQVVMGACDAIKQKKSDWDSMSQYFTNRGYQQYKDLLGYGNARIISTEGCRYLRIGQEVQCRSIPVSFSFSKGKIQYENLVFTLLEDENKIDGVQFALEERALKNIMGDTDIDESAQLSLINFMENYKTAFAFQDWNYIETIFSDDAVIITGRVIQRSSTMADSHQLRLNDVVYSKYSKKEYINRLRATKKEWINIKFGDTQVERSRQGDTYGLSMYQDYYSANYGDHGYLFLLIDTTDPEQPLIRVRAWQPNQHFDMGTYDHLITTTR